MGSLDVMPHPMDVGSQEKRETREKEREREREREMDPEL